MHVERPHTESAQRLGHSRISAPYWLVRSAVQVGSVAYVKPTGLTLHSPSSSARKGVQGEI